MDNKGDFFGDDLTFNKKIDDDFAANVKTKTIDFLSSERSDEKTDVKEKNVVDFLDFHDDLGDENFHQQQNDPILLPTVEKSDDVEKPKLVEQKIDFANTAVAVEEDYLHPYGASKTNEKFISSEDLLTDFKDPIPIEEPQKELPPPPVPAPMKPVEQPLPKPQPVVEEKKSLAIPVKVAESQIEAEKIFKSFGLGKYAIELLMTHVCFVSVSNKKYFFAYCCGS